MANPVLTPERWQRELETEPGWAAPSATQAPQAAAFGSQMAPPPVTATGGAAMTVGGTLTATLVLFLCILVTGWVGWSQVTQTSTFVETSQGLQEQISTNFPGWVYLPMIAAVILGFVTAFKPKLARVTAPLYALGYGFALGAISHMFDLQYNGIVLQAVAATLAVFAVMLFLYSTRIIKVTRRFMTVVIGATAGIFVMYLVTWIATLFGADLAFWNDPTPLGIGISVLIVIVAALNLAIDFAFIEQATKAGAPKYMEWYGAFGITVTVIWLYLEILRLLSLLRQQ